MRSHQFFFLVLIFIASSCNDPEPKFNMVFTNSANLQEGVLYYLFLADNNGELLEYIPLRNEAVATFTKPKVLRENYQFSIAKVFSNTVRISTYLNTPPNSYYYRIGDGQNNSPISVGKFSIYAPERNSYNHFTVDSEKMKSLGILNNTQFEVNLTSPTSDLFIGVTTSSDPVPRYFYNPEIQTGGSMTFNAELINGLSVMNAEVVDLVEEQSYMAYATIFGNTSTHSNVV